MYPTFSLAFNIAGDNAVRLQAFELYRQAFDARKIAESKPPDGDDLHIVMEINGFHILLGPGERMASNNLVTCQLQFADEVSLRKAYDVLTMEGCNYSIGSYPWAEVGALVTDKYGISWWLFTAGQ